MILNVYRYRGDGRPGVAPIEHVTSVVVDEYPRDQISFAEEHGGDLVLGEQDEPMDVADYKRRMRLLRECPKP